MEKYRERLIEREYVRYTGILLGSVIYAVGMNFFVVPAGIYTGGVMGICQLIRTLLVSYLHLPVGGIDIAGILFYIVNIPMLLIAWRKIEHSLVMKTLITVTFMTLFLSLIPVRDVLGGDQLTKCLIGGIVVGAGVGIVLMMGGTSGGMDVIGFMMMKNGSNVSIGQVNLVTNIFLYAVCAIMFQLPTAIYSIIYAFISSFTTDKLHTQNISVEVNIITKIDTGDMEREIMSSMNRGVTKLRGEGAYTEEPVNVLYILISKYEVGKLRSIIAGYDPSAFVVIKSGTMVYGHYLKKF